MFWALYMRFFMVRDSCVMTAACWPPPRRRFRCRSGHRMSLNPVHTSDHNTWHHRCGPQKTSATTMTLRSVQMLDSVACYKLLCVDEGTPLSSWRKPFLWGVSQTLPDAEDQFSPAQAALPPPADRPAHHMMEIRHRFLLFARTATNESNSWCTSWQMLQWWLKMMK